MTDNNETTCEACDEVIYAKDLRFGQDGTAYHDNCWFQEFDYASRVYIIREGQAQSLMVCAHGVYEAEHLEDYQGGLKITRGYHRTDGWRGYYETRVEGWHEVEAGWTTGGWGDPVADAKQDFNAWAEQVIENPETLPEGLGLVLAFDPTSNVFSTAVGVFTDNESLFEETMSVPAGL